MSSSIPNASLHSDTSYSATCHSTMTRIACGKPAARQERVTEQPKTCHSTVTPTRTYSRRDNSSQRSWNYSLGANTTDPQTGNRRP